MLHIKITLILFFVNLMLLGFFPQYTFLQDANIFILDNNDNPVVNPEFSDSVTSTLDEEDSSTAFSNFGFLDLFGFAVDFFKFILQMFLGVFYLILNVPLDPLIKMFAFFPVTLLYAFAIIGWFKR